MNTFGSRRRAHGFTLLEMMCAVAVAGILSSIAYPTYQNVVQKVRRADARVAVAQVQTAQERYRADHPAYGSLADIRLSAASPSGHYRLLVANAGSTGYEVQAKASGAQAGDTDCRQLKLTVQGNRTDHASGRDDRYANDDAANRKCWGL